MPAAFPKHGCVRSLTTIDVDLDLILVRVFETHGQTATLLYEYEDAAYADIASVLGCSVKAVENKLYRARQSLREKLARWL